MKKSTVNRLMAWNLILFGLFTAMLSVFVYGYARHAIVRSSGQNAAKVLTSTADQLEEKVYTLNQTSKLLMSQLFDMKTLRQPGYVPTFDSHDSLAIISALNDFVFLNDKVEAAFLFDKNGRSYGTRYYNYDYNLDEIQEELSEAQGKMIWYTQQGIDRIALVRSIYSDELRPAGFLLVAMEKDIFDDIMNWQRSELTSEVAILDTRNHNLVYTTAAEAGEMLIQEEKIEIPEGNVQNKVVYIDGQEYRQYVYQNGTGFLFCYFIPSSFFTQGLEVVLGIILSVVLGYGLIVAVLIMNVNHHINKPLKLINQNLRQFSIKKDIIPVEFARDDEFRELYNSFCSMADRINSLVETIYEKDILYKEQELAILQNQINPHFIYNTFEIINSMAMNNQNDKICTVTKSLSNIMRYTINSQEFEVRLRDELAHVGDYIKIQQERFMGELLYIQDIPSELLDMGIPKLTLQPIVENCISHAFMGQRKNRVITLSAGRQEHGYRVDITDNGCGIPGEQCRNLFSGGSGSDGNGVALKNINRRLQLHYGLESGLQVDSMPGFGTTISVIIKKES